jgi:threonine dehydrogenase-like Zn-dependent dehydrogenase
MPTYPRRYGYSWVGEVLARGEGVAEPAIGSHVFALAPHGDLHALEVHAARLIGQDIPPARAVLAPSLETAITCVWDAGVSLGDRVVVLGGGIVGLLSGWLARAAGGRVSLVEPSPRRRAMAHSLGIEDAIAPAEDDPRGEADVVIEATGRPSALDTAVAHAGREATVVVASFYGSLAHPVHLGSEFHRRRLTLRATQVSSIPPSRAPRWTPTRRFELVHRLLADGRLDRLLEPASPFDDAPGVYARLAAAPGDHGQITFDYRRA